MHVLLLGMCRRGAGSKLKVEGHEFRRFAPEKKLFLLCPHFSVVPPQFGGGHCTHQGGHKDGQSIAHCLCVKKWSVAETETKLQ